MATTNTASSGILSQINKSTNPSTATLKADSTNSKAAASGTKLTKDYNEFMLLLTTQLQHQDPTEPLDTNQFTQQLVQFSTVEQAVATNTNLEKLVSLTSNSQINNAVGYIGKTVETEGNAAFLNNGKSELAYTLPAGVYNSTLSVLDSSGKAVYTAKTPIAAGDGTFVWDGTNSFTGRKLPDGIYSFAISAKDAKGNALTPTTYTAGHVTGVTNVAGEVAVTLNSALDVPLSKVRSVREAIASPVAATPGGTTPSTTPTPAV